MSHVHTRIATFQDLEPVAALFDAYRQFYEQAPDLALARQFVADRIQHQESVILVAETDERQILGFCQLYPSFCSVLARPIYVLYDLYVAVQGRKAGVGRALLLAAHAQALHSGKARMDLTTAKTNGPAQSLYESLGWVRDEVFYTYNKTVATERLCGGVYTAEIEALT